ncbi:MAG: hypothetical protein VW239_04760 [Candidatus Nanopelagicales bacterium]
MSEQPKDYETRVMRPAPAKAASGAKWKYKNAHTGRIEFHESKQSAEHLRLIRDCDGKVYPAPAGTPENG